MKNRMPNTEIRKRSEYRNPKRIVRVVSSPFVFLKNERAKIHAVH